MHSVDSDWAIKLLKKSVDEEEMSGVGLAATLLASTNAAVKRELESILR